MIPTTEEFDSEVLFSLNTTNCLSDIQPTYSHHTANIQPSYSQHTANIQPTYSQHTANIQPSSG